MKSKLDELKKLIEMTQAKYQMPQEQRKELVKKKLLNDYFIIDMEIIRSLLFKKEEAEVLMKDLQSNSSVKEYVLFHEKEMPLILAAKPYFTQIHQYFSSKLQESFWITPGRMYTFLINYNCNNEIKIEEGKLYLETLKTQVEVDQLPTSIKSYY